MKNRIFFFKVLIIVVIFVFSCSPREKLADKSVPAGIINPDSIVNIITEIHISESILRKLKTTTKPTDKTAETYYSEIFKKHGITREQYEKSIDYYQQNLETYQDIYEKVITLLSQKQAENTTEE